MEIPGIQILPNGDVSAKTKKFFSSSTWHNLKGFINTHLPDVFLCGFFTVALSVLVPGILQIFQGINLSPNTEELKINSFKERNVKILNPETGLFEDKSINVIEDWTFNKIVKDFVVQIGEMFSANLYRPDPTKGIITFILETALVNLCIFVLAYYQKISGNKDYYPHVLKETDEIFHRVFGRSTKEVLNGELNPNQDMPNHKRYMNSAFLRALGGILVLEGGVDDGGRDVLDTLISSCKETICGQSDKPVDIYEMIFRKLTNPEELKGEQRDDRLLESSRYKKIFLNIFQENTPNNKLKIMLRLTKLTEKKAKEHKEKINWDLEALKYFYKNL